MDEKIRLLQERVQHLEKINRTMVEALELAASLGDFQASISKCEGPQVILTEACSRLRRLLSFHTVSFFLIDEKNAEFQLTFCDPQEQVEAIEQEKDHLIEHGIFAWALNRKRSVFARSERLDKTVLVHVLATAARIRGVFVGVVKGSIEEIPDSFLLLHTIVLLHTANALESMELYRWITAVNRDLAEEKERLSVTLQSIGDGVITVDMHGRVDLLNRTAREFIGFSESEAKGKAIQEILSVVQEKTGNGCNRDFSEVLSQDKVVDLIDNGILVAKDGRQRYVTIRGGPIFDRPDAIKGAVLVIRDVTDQRRIEAELVRAEKLESLGHLAGGIAHDFNNILTAIAGNVELIRMGNGQNGQTEKRLDLIEKAVLRAKDLTGQLLTFARGVAPVKKVISVAKLLTDTAKLALSGSNVRIEFAIEEGLHNVEADEGQLGQVIGNLVINARQTMAEEGVIRITACNCEKSKAEVPSLAPGRYVRITVEDTGVGIPEEHMPFIFDPYCTFKPQGNGLGLAVVYSIVKRHEGHVTVESKTEGGTRIVILLPATVKELPDAWPMADKSMADKGRILVMDDEDIIRNMLALLLSLLGYEVELARDGDEALAMYEEAKKPARPSIW